MIEPPEILTNGIAGMVIMDIKCLMIFSDQYQIKHLSKPHQNNEVLCLNHDARFKLQT